MAEKYLGSPLAGFGSVWGTQSGERAAPGSIEMVAPIQPVYDTARMAHALRGFYTLQEADSIIVIAAGATTGRVFVSRATLLAIALVAARLRELAINPNEAWVWLCAIGATVPTASAANIDFASAGPDPGGGGLFQAGPIATHQWDNTTTNPLEAGGQHTLFRTEGATGPFDSMRYPFLLPPDPDAGVRYIATTNAGGGTTVTFPTLYFIGPQGVVPPAVATVAQ